MRAVYVDHTASYSYIWVYGVVEYSGHTYSIKGTIIRRRSKPYSDPLIMALKAFHNYPL